MFEIDGADFYFDFDKLIEECQVDDLTESSTLSLNIFKYDLLKMCVERIMDDVSDLGTQNDVFAKNELSTAFKLSYNTLLKNEIIVEDE